MVLVDPASAGDVPPEPPAEASVAVPPAEASPAEGLAAHTQTAASCDSAEAG